LSSDVDNEEFDVANSSDSSSDSSGGESKDASIFKSPTQLVSAFCYYHCNAKINYTLDLFQRRDPYSLQALGRHLVAMTQDRLPSQLITF
jgi:hypothetical protein